MDRPPPNFPFDRYADSRSSTTKLTSCREPRSAGYPPLRHHSGQSDSSPILPGPTPRYSDPGPSVPQHIRNDYSRHYSVASTASSSGSSVFAKSYSISSGMYWAIFRTDDQHLVTKDVYLEEMMDTSRHLSLDGPPKQPNSHQSVNSPRT
jgi:hypothetical protein